MAFFGTIMLWVFAVFGAVMAAVMIGLYAADPPAKVEPSPQKPQPQVTNLRVVPSPVAEAPKDQLPVLQKTTMQITTTRFMAPTRREIEAGK